MASHGTHDFCHTRALLTERLIKERGFSAVAVDFLDKVDPEAARRARYRYSCFEHFGGGYASLRIRRQLLSLHVRKPRQVVEPPRPAHGRNSERPAIEDSYESLFHLTAIPCFLLNFRGADWLSGVLNQIGLERAMGVIYCPNQAR